MQQDTLPQLRFQMAQKCPEMAQKIESRVGRVAESEWKVSKLSVSLSVFIFNMMKPGQKHLIMSLLVQRRKVITSSYSIKCMYKTLALEDCGWGQVSNLADTGWRSDSKLQEARGLDCPSGPTGTRTEGRGEISSWNDEINVYSLF